MHFLVDNTFRLDVYVAPVRRKRAAFHIVGIAKSRAAPARVEDAAPAASLDVNIANLNWHREVSMPTRAVRVAVVYGNRLFGECLGEALSTDPDVEVVLCLPANPSTWMKVVQSAESVVLLQSSTTDAQSPTNGNRVPLNLQNRILVVGDDDEEDSVRRAVDTGATAYLPCSVSFKTATEAVKALANGGAVTSPKVVAFLFTQLARVQTKRNHSIPQQRLTRRERQVIQLVGAGLTNKEIATRLGIEVQTVKNHVHNILDKLEKKGRHAAARYAFETGLAAPMPRPLTEQTRSQA